MKHLTIGVSFCAAALSACSHGEPGRGSYDKDDLALGSSGPEVRKVFDYLTLYGCFENAALRANIQGWQPIICELPTNPDVFDDAHEHGVRAYQKLMGISVTGVVDSPTRALMATPRCGHPDYDMEAIDPEQKFHIRGGFSRFLNTKYAFKRFLGIGSEPQRFIAARRRWTDVSDVPGSIVQRLCVRSFTHWTNCSIVGHWRRRFEHVARLAAWAVSCPTPRTA
jgi:hypothetical protein